MKRFVLLAFMSSLCTIVLAQTSRYDINVYTDPMSGGIEWTPIMGSAYRERYRQLQNADRKRDRTFDWIQDLNQQQRQLDMMYYRSIAEGNQVVSEDVATINGINLASKQITPIKVIITKRKSGDISMKCIGIKKNEQWKPLEKSITALLPWYEKSKSESEKKMLLGLMELGNYLLDADTEMYIIK